MLTVNKDQTINMECCW